MTTPLDSATPISYMGRNFGNRKAFTAVFGHFSLRLRRFSIIYASGLKSVITVFLSDIDFLQRDENFAI